MRRMAISPSTKHTTQPVEAKLPQCETSRKFCGVRRSRRPDLFAGAMPDRRAVARGVTQTRERQPARRYNVPGIERRQFAVRVRDGGRTPSKHLDRPPHECGRGARAHPLRSIQVGAECSGGSDTRPRRGFPGVRHRSPAALYIPNPGCESACRLSQTIVLKHKQFQRVDALINGTSRPGDPICAPGYFGTTATAARSAA